VSLISYFLAPNLPGVPQAIRVLSHEGVADGAIGHVSFVSICSTHHVVLILGFLFVLANNSCHFFNFRDDLILMVIMC